MALELVVCVEFYDSKAVTVTFNSSCRVHVHIYKQQTFISEKYLCWLKWRKSVCRSKLLLSGRNHDVEIRLKSQIITTIQTHLKFINLKNALILPFSKRKVIFVRFLCFFSGFGTCDHYWRGPMMKCKSNINFTILYSNSTRHKHNSFTFIQSVLAKFAEKEQASLWMTYTFTKLWRSWTWTVYTWDSSGHS